MKLSETILQNSKVLYQTMKQLSLESQYFEFHLTKTKAVKLKLKNILREDAVKCCKVAIGLSISDYYNNHIIGQDSNGKTSCNSATQHAEYLPSLGLEDILKKNGHYRKRINSRLSQTTIMKEIDNKRPICINMQWEGSHKTHFIIIYGYELNHDGFLIHIADPWDGLHTIDYENFATFYHTSWTNTYLTA
jgi:hypothetical protein